MIVTAWNPADIPDMALRALPLPVPVLCRRRAALAASSTSARPTCSSGVPFNIACYALLTLMMAQVTGFRPGEFIHTFGDAHLYLNHLEQADLQLTRTPRALPRMEIDPAVRSIFDFKLRGFRAVGLRPASAHQGRRWLSERPKSTSPSSSPCRR